MKKEFHLGDVLSMTTGRLLSPRGMEGIYDILGFMTGETLFTHQLPHASRKCSPHLEKQFPELHTPEMDFALGELTLMLERIDKQDIDNLLIGWISKQALRLGLDGVNPILEVENIPVKEGATPVDAVVRTEKNTGEPIDQSETIEHLMDEYGLTQNEVKNLILAAPAMAEALDDLFEAIPITDGGRWYIHEQNEGQQRKMTKAFKQGVKALKIAREGATT